MNYYLKRRFNKISTWIVLLLHLLFVGWFFFILGKFSLETPNETNDLMRLIFWALMIFPTLALTIFFSPLSYLFWGWIDDIASETEKDGTDLFFLSTAVPTSRKKIFWNKVSFLTSSLTIIYSLLFALPYSLLLWKSEYFSSFTSSLQIGLFLGWNFLITPLLFIAPLVIFLLALASQESIWYPILKWFCRLLPIITGLILVPIARFLFKGEDSKIAQVAKDVWLWLDDHYTLVISVIIGGLILLAFLTVQLAYKKFQEKDLN